MKVLLDHCLPRRIALHMPEHEVATTYSQGWAALKNGKLLAAAHQTFDVFVTADQNLQNQQQLKQYNIGIVVLCSISNRMQDLEPLMPLLRDAVSKAGPAQVIRIKLPLEF